MNKLAQYLVLAKTSQGLQALASLILTLILGRYCLSDYDYPNYASIILFLCALGLMISKSYQYLEQPSIWPAKTGAIQRRHTVFYPILD